MEARSGIQNCSTRLNKAPQKCKQNKKPIFPGSSGSTGSTPETRKKRVGRGKSKSYPRHPRAALWGTRCSGGTLTLRTYYCRCLRQRICSDFAPAGHMVIPPNVSTDYAESYRFDKPTQPAGSITANRRPTFLSMAAPIGTLWYFMRNVPASKYVQIFYFVFKITFTS